jgi:hypothetical protein
MFDLNTVDLILAGVGGLTVLGVTQILKQFLKASGVGAVLISLAVSAGFTAYYLLANALWNVVTFVGYSLLVFAVSNGVFRAVHLTKTNNP